MSTEPDARLERLLDQMTVEELVRLTAGDDIWHTAAVERLGIPRMRVSDGPVGVRGTRFDGEGAGATTTALGEAVFTTGMTGYQETLTDPSFNAQIITFSAPMIGSWRLPPAELTRISM